MRKPDFDKSLFFNTILQNIDLWLTFGTGKTYY